MEMNTNTLLGNGKLSKINLKVAFCHRIPERTFRINGRLFPVCARCTGLYIGLCTFIITTIFFNWYSLSNLILIGIALLIPTGLDGMTQALRIRKSNNIIRASTGLIGGLGYGMVILSSVRFAQEYLGVGI